MAIGPETCGTSASFAGWDGQLSGSGNTKLSSLPRLALPELLFWSLVFDLFAHKLHQSGLLTTSYTKRVLVVDQAYWWLWNRSHAVQSLPLLGDRLHYRST